MTWGIELWKRLEERQLPFRIFLLLFLSIVTFRNLLESFTSSGYIEQFSTYALHYPLAFVISFLMLTILLSLCSGERIERVSRLMLYLWLLILLPPILDLFASTVGGGERKAIGWLSYQKGRFWWTFMNLYNPFLTLRGATVGIRFQSFMSCILAAIYVYAKSRSVVRTLITPFVVSFFSFCFFSLPTLFVAISGVVTPAVRDTHAMVFHSGHFFHNFTQVVATSMASYQLMLTLVLFLVWLVVYDRKKVGALLASLDWRRCANYVLLSGAGFIVGWRMFLPSMSLEGFTGNHKDLSALIGLAVSLWGVVLFGDSLSSSAGERTPRAESGGNEAIDRRYDPYDVMLVSLFIAIAFSAVTSYPVFVWIAVLLILEVVSRIPPFEASRVPVVGAIVHSAGAMASFLTGFTLFTGNLAPTLLPPHLALTLFVIFLLAGIRGSSALWNVVPTAAAIVAAGILLPGTRVLVGMLLLAGLFLAASLAARSGVRRLLVPAVLFGSFVFCLSCLWPFIPKFSGDPRRFPDEIAHSVYATFLEHDGLDEHAVLEYERAYELGSPDPWVAFQLGYSAAQKGDREAALTYYHRAVELDAHYSKALNNIATLLSEMGRNDEASAYWDSLLTGGRQNEDYLGNFATFYIGQGEADLGLRKLLAADEHLGSDEAKTAALSLVTALAGECGGENLENCVNAAEQAPGDPILQLLAAAGLGEAGREREALEFYDRALTQLPSLRAVDFFRGSACQQLGEYRKAVAAYHEFLSDYPDHIEARINLSAAYLSMDDIASALRILEDLASEYPGESRVMINLANAHLKEDDAEGAEEILRTLIAHGEDTPLVHFNLGVILEKRGKPAEAVGQYRQAIAGGMADPALYTRVGQFLEQAGRRDDALDMYRKALELDPGFRPAQQRLLRLTGGGRGGG